MENNRSCDNVAGWGDDGYTLDAVLQGGVDVDQTNAQNETALHCAAEFSNYNNVVVLLKWNADVHARNDLHWTPLHKAAVSETPNPEIIAALVAKGADRHAVTLLEETPAQLAWKFWYQIPDSAIACIALLS